MAKPIITLSKAKRIYCIDTITEWLYHYGFEKTEKMIVKGMHENYEALPATSFVAFSRGVFKKMYKIFKELYV